MPLKKGKSKKVQDENVEELVRTYKTKGKIGNTNPKSMEHAQKIAVAIAMDKARKSKKRKKK